MSQVKRIYVEMNDGSKVELTQNLMIETFQRGEMISSDEQDSEERIQNDRLFRELMANLVWVIAGGVAVSMYGDYENDLIHGVPPEENWRFGEDIEDTLDAYDMRDLVAGIMETLAEKAVRETAA